MRNVAAIYDRGKLIGRHYKHSLWVDRDRPYRDEPSQMIPGGPIEVYKTRLGRFAVLICFENMVPANLDALRGKVDYVLSPYNSEQDLSDVNIGIARRLGIPSAWVDRTGTVYCGGDYMTNLGTAGMVDASGRIITRSRDGPRRSRSAKSRLKRWPGNRRQAFFNLGMQTNHVGWTLVRLGRG